MRRAIAHALNVDEIIEKIYFGQAAASPTAITVYNKALFDPSLPAYAYDPDEANRLLDEAGHRRGPDGVRFGIGLTWNTEGAIPQSAPILYRQALAAVGIDAAIVTSDFAALTKRTTLTATGIWRSTVTDRPSTRPSGLSASITARASRSACPSPTRRATRIPKRTRSGTRSS